MTRDAIYGVMVVYSAVFSVSRLVQLLTDAGFDVEEPAELRGGVLRFDMDPATRECHVFGSDSLRSDWKELSGHKRPVEHVQARAYL